MSKPSIALVGAGAAGSAIAVALHRAGYPVAAVASRSIVSAQNCAALVDCDDFGTDLPAAARRAEIIILACPDGAIESCCQSIAQSGGFSSGQLVLHLSGALTSDALESARQAGADVLSLHPVQTMVEPLQSAKLLKNAWFCLEGSDAAVARGEAIVDDISGKHLVIDKHNKALYHAALCLCSNYLIALEAVAVEMLGNAGIDKRNALPLLMPLIRGSVDTLENCGLPQALTGPISRGDASTIEKHLTALSESPANHQQVYKTMGHEALKLAGKKGKIAADNAHTIQSLLQSFTTTGQSKS